MTQRLRGSGGIFLLLFVLGNLPLAAQVSDSARTRVRRDSAVVKGPRQRGLRLPLNPRELHLTDVAIALGSVGVISLLDESVQHYTQRHRSKTLEDAAAFFRKEGEPLWYAGVSLGVLGIGLVTNKPAIKRAGGRLVATVAVSAVVMEGAKYLVGRSRPNENVGAYDFHPFTSIKDSTGQEARGSMPSGHVTAAFAVATSLVEDIHSVPIQVALYAFATGTAFSRVYENRHWVSDTVLGAILGITTARLVTGRWRIFHLKPPGFLLASNGAPIVGWNISFTTSAGSPAD
jgi:membrane-associated phospholipid phosphatase